MRFFSNILRGNWQVLAESLQLRNDSLLRQGIDLAIARDAALQNELDRVRNLYNMKWASDEAKTIALENTGVFIHHFSSPTGARNRFTTKDVRIALANAESDD